VIRFSEKVIHYFMKTDATQPWGEFNVKVKLEEEVKEDPIQTLHPTSVIKPPSKTQTSKAEIEIACLTCTYLNPMNTARCELCGNSLGK